MGWVRFGPLQQKYQNAFKARLDKIRLHQAVKLLVVLGWVGSKFSHLRWVGLDRVTQSGRMDNSVTRQSQTSDFGPSAPGLHSQSHRQVRVYDWDMWAWPLLHENMTSSIKPASQDRRHHATKNVVKFGIQFQMCSRRQDMFVGEK